MGVWGLAPVDSGAKPIVRVQGAKQASLKPTTFMIFKQTKSCIWIKSRSMHLPTTFLKIMWNKANDVCINVFMYTSASLVYSFVIGHPRHLPPWHSSKTNFKMATAAICMNKSGTCLFTDNFINAGDCIVLLLTSTTVNGTSAPQHSFRVSPIVPIPKGRNKNNNSSALISVVSHWVVFMLNLR